MDKEIVSQIIGQKKATTVLKDRLMILTANFQSDALRLSVASVFMGLTITFWTVWWKAAIWVGVCVAIACIGPIIYRQALSRANDNPADLQRAFVKIALHRFAYVTCWSSLLIFAWDTAQPATFALAYLFVLGTAPQNAATSSAIPKLALIEIAPKFLAGLLIPLYLWATVPADVQSLYLALSIVTLFFFFYVAKLIRDLHSSTNLLLAQRYQMEALKKKAEQADRDKSTFLGIVSHELRTPINGISVASELLRHAQGGDVERYLDIIDQSAQVILHTIDDTLDLSAIQSGNINLKNHPQDLHHLVANTFEMVRRANRKETVQLRMMIAPDTPQYIIADGYRLRQILMNLLNNAVRYTVQGHVQLLMRPVQNTGEGPPHVQFQIEDSGIGITPENRELIFEGYRQIDQNARKGVGLGLTICRGIVSAMDGQIWVTDNVYRGSTFWVEFPITLSTKNAFDAHSQSIAKNVTVPALDILVVEDNEANQVVAHDLLKQAGHSVTIAVDGMAAIRQIESKQFDLIFMDLQLPVMDGYETTREIHKILAPQNAPKIIALTAQKSPEIERTCTQAGMQAVLSKPYTSATLLGMVAQVTSPDMTDHSAPPSSPDTQPQTNPMSAKAIESLLDLDMMAQYFALSPDGNGLAYMRTSIEDIGNRLQHLEKLQTSGDKTDFHTELHKLTGLCGFIGMRAVCLELRRLQEQHGNATSSSVDLRGVLVLYRQSAPEIMRHVNTMQNALQPIATVDENIP